MAIKVLDLLAYRNSIVKQVMVIIMEEIVVVVIVMIVIKAN